MKITIFPVTTLLQRPPGPLQFRGDDHCWAQPVRWFQVIITIITLTACQLPAPFPNNLSRDSLEFNVAIHQLSSNLLRKIQTRQTLLVPLMGNQNLLLFNPFIDTGSGQVVQVSLAIEERFLAEAHQNFKQFKLERFNWNNLAAAGYVINGLLKYQPDPINLNRKYYQVIASVVDLKTKKVVVQEQVRIISDGLNYQPTPSYEDNPMFVKDRHLQEFIQMVEQPEGSQIDEDFYKFIQTKSLIVEAQTAYDQGDYQTALRLFEEVVQRPDGKIIEGYGGLYTTNYRLGRWQQAEDNFAQMVAVGIENGTLPIKLLFEPNLVEFLSNQELRKQYSIWLRQISYYFQKTPSVCVNIVGHTSKYGLHSYNQTLSERRALRIQAWMREFFPEIIERSRVTGKGDLETIVGTMPDSAENAIDRRVEFKIIDCSEVNSPTDS